MVEARWFRTLELAALVALVGVGASAQEEAVCAGGREVLVDGWEARDVPGAEGRPTRATFECLDDGSIRQLVEVSSDGGRTWTKLFESTFRPAPAEPMASSDPPVGTPPPRSSSPAGSVPAGSPASPGAGAQPQAARQASVQGSEVQAVSRELEREEIPADEAPELVMASPMVLEVVPGEVDAYPEGTAWSTDETAGFICSHVVIKKVTVAREEKGGGVNLEVGALLFTKKRQRRLDLEIEAMLDGEVVASRTLEKVRVGLNIPGHDKNGMIVEAGMRLSTEVFERMFADGADRKLRLTLTVAD